MNKKNRDMISGPLFGNIVAYTIPIILTSLLQLLFNAADLVIVGRFCGSLSVGAVGATSSLTMLMVNLFIGLSVGAGVSVAHGIGSRDDDAVSKTVHTALPMAIISGVILTFVGMTFSETFLELMGTPENVLPLSTSYMRIYFAGMIFSLVYNFVAAILRAAGDTKSPLIFLTIAGVINVVLNVFFVTVFDMNVAGVALATTISQGVSAVLVVIVLMKRTDACKLVLRKMRIHKPQLLKIIKIGLPAGIQGSLFSISNVLIQSSINSFGDVFMRGNAAAGNIEGFVYVAINAFHQTAVNFVGQNVGANRYDRVKKILGICLGSVTVVGIVFGSLAYIFSPSLLSIYITDSQEAIAYGITRLAYISLPYFVCGMMDVSTGALRGMGSSLSSMFISVLGICGFRVVWIYTVFKMLHTPESLYISYLISWTLTLAIQLIAFAIVYKKRIRRQGLISDYGKKAAEATN